MFTSTNDTLSLEVMLMATCFVWSKAILLPSGPTSFRVVSAITGVNALAAKASGRATFLVKPFTFPFFM